MKKLLIWMLLSIALIFGITNYSYATTVQDSETPTVDSVVNGDTATKEQGEASEENSSNDDLDNIEWAEDSEEESGSEDTEDAESEDEEEEDEGIYSENPNYDLDGYIPNDLPKVTIDDAIEWVQRKGSELVSLVQVSGFYIVLIAAIVCIILIAIGWASNRGGVAGMGVGGLIIIALCYVGVYAGPFLLEWFRAWAVS